MEKASVVHDGLPAMLSVDNMANGAVYELFGEAIKRLAANVADPNTEPTQKRKVTLTIDVSPYKDRTGAEYTIKVETKLAGLKPVESTMYFAKRGGEFLAFGRNTNQEEIQFGMGETAPAETTDKPTKPH